MDLTSDYAALVHWLSGNGSVPDTVMHIHGGMIILLTVRLLTGRSLATPWPLLAVFIGAFAKEFADYLVYDRFRQDSLSDIINTVFWPSVLFVGLRVRRAKQGGSGAAADEAKPPARPS